VLDDDGSLTAGDIRDKGGRLIRRRVQGRVQNLGYDGRNRLTRWDWDGSAGTSCTYDYDHAGRRILTRETVGGTTKVTRYVYDGAEGIGVVIRHRTKEVLRGQSAFDTF
jgi:YD repeat-containing protein